MSVSVFYSCPDCGLYRAEVEIRFREPGESVLLWITSVVEPALAADHAERCPECDGAGLSTNIPRRPGAPLGQPVHH